MVRRIFNADEFDLFYNYLTDKTYHFKREKCSGEKHSKLHLTGMAAGNAKGERLRMFTIGKLKNPRCFKGQGFMQPLLVTTVFRYRLSFNIYSDTRRRPNCGRQGEIFKIDTSTLLQMAFPVLFKALVM